MSIRTGSTIIVVCVCVVIAGAWAWETLGMQAAHNRSYNSLSKRDQQKLAAIILDGAGLVPLPKGSKLLSATNGRGFITSSHRVVFEADRKTIDGWLLKSDVPVDRASKKHELQRGYHACHYEYGEVTTDYPNHRVTVYTADY